MSFSIFFANKTRGFQGILQLNNLITCCWLIITNWGKEVQYQYLFNNFAQQGFARRDFYLKFLFKLQWTSKTIKSQIESNKVPGKSKTLQNLQSISQVDLWFSEYYILTTLSPFADVPNSHVHFRRHRVTVRCSRIQWAALFYDPTLSLSSVRPRPRCCYYIWRTSHKVCARSPHQP